LHGEVRYPKVLLNAEDPDRKARDAQAELDEALDATETEEHGPHEGRTE